MSTASSSSPSSPVASPVNNNGNPAAAGAAPIQSASLASFYGTGVDTTGSAPVTASPSPPGGPSVPSAEPSHQNERPEGQPAPPAPSASPSPPPTHSANNSASLSISGTSSFAADVGRSPSPPAPASSPVINPEMKELMSRFHEFHTDLSHNPKRHLLKEGSLFRHATWKNVERYALLFNDIFVICEKIEKGANKGKLVQKQILILKDIAVEKGKKEKDFNLVSAGQRDYSFTCSSDSEKNEWWKLLNDNINHQKLTSNHHIEVASNAPAKKASEMADVHKDKYVHATLHSAVKEQEDELLLHLLSERGDDPNQVDADGNTALHLAVAAGYQSGVSLLLGFGADMNKIDRNGDSVLHVAIRNDEYAIAMMLISKKANFDALNAKGLSLFWVLACGPYKLGSDEEEHAEGEAHKSDEQKSDSESESEDEDQNSKKMKIQSLKETMNLMIDEGVDVDMKDKTQKSLLSHLATIHNPHSLEVLLERGANINTIDALGLTPLHHACQAATNTVASTADVLATVRLLLTRGSMPNARDHNLNTPLHLTKSLSVCGALLVYGARTELKNLGKQNASYYFDELAAKGDPSDPLTIMKDAKLQFQSRPDTASDGRESRDVKNWVEDSQSDSCFLCATSFSFSNRKHHCRRCGLLCCGACSTKKFTLNNSSEKCRACDACYNTLAELAFHANKVKRRKAAQLRKEQAENAKEIARLKAEFDKNHQEFLSDQKKRQEAVAEEEKKIREQLVMKEDGSKPKPTAATGPGGKYATVGANAPPRNSTIHATSTMMSENKRLALERGEKLSRLEERAQRMEDDAADFANLAQKLKEKQKNSWF